MYFLNDDDNNEIEYNHAISEALIDDITKFFNNRKFQINTIIDTTKFEKHNDFDIICKDGVVKSNKFFLLSFIPFFESLFDIDSIEINSIKLPDDYTTDDINFMLNYVNSYNFDNFTISLKHENYKKNYINNIKLSNNDIYYWIDRYYLLDYFCVDKKNEILDYVIPIILLQALNNNIFIDLSELPDDIIEDKNLYSSVIHYLYHYNNHLPVLLDESFYSIDIIKKSNEPNYLFETQKEIFKSSLVKMINLEMPRNRFYTKVRNIIKEIGLDKFFELINIDNEIDTSSIFKNIQNKLSIIDRYIYLRNIDYANYYNNDNKISVNDDFIESKDIPINIKYQRGIHYVDSDNVPDEYFDN